MNINPEELLVTAVCIDGAYKGREVSGYYVMREPPMTAYEPKPEPTHYIINSGFADWNLERPLNTFIIDVSTLRKADFIS